MYNKLKINQINTKKILTMTFFMLCWLLFPEISEAAGATATNGDTGLAVVGTNTGLTAQSWAQNLQVVALLFGVAFIVFGINHVIKSKDGRTTAGGGVAMIIAGAALTSIIALQGTLSTTIFGQDSVETQISTMIQG